MGGLRKFKVNLEKNLNSIDVKKETFRNVITGEIYRIMKAENKNQTDLSMCLGISKAAVSKLLTGDRNFTVDKIVEIADTLGYLTKISFYKNSPVAYIASFKKGFRYSQQTIRRITLNKVNGDFSFEEEVKEKWEVASELMIKKTPEYKIL